MSHLQPRCQGNDESVLICPFPRRGDIVSIHYLFDTEALILCPRNDIKEQTFHQGAGIAGHVALMRSNHNGMSRASDKDGQRAIVIGCSDDISKRSLHSGNESSQPVRICLGAVPLSVTRDNVTGRNGSTALLLRDSARMQVEKVLTKELILVQNSARRGNVLDCHFNVAVGTHNTPLEQQRKMKGSQSNDMDSFEQFASTWDEKDFARIFAKQVLKEPKPSMEFVNLMHPFLCGKKNMQTLLKMVDTLSPHFTKEEALELRRYSAQMIAASSNTERSARFGYLVHACIAMTKRKR